MAPDTHTHTHAHIHTTPPAPPQYNSLFGLKRESEAHPLSPRFAVTWWAAERPHNFTASTPGNLWPGADLRNFMSEKGEATLWRVTVEEEAGDLAWQLIH